MFIIKAFPLFQHHIFIYNCKILPCADPENFARAYVVFFFVFFFFVLFCFFVCFFLLFLGGSFILVCFFYLILLSLFFFISFFYEGAQRFRLTLNTGHCWPTRETPFNTINPQCLNNTSYSLNGKEFFSCTPDRDFRCFHLVMPICNPKDGFSISASLMMSKVILRTDFSIPPSHS